MGSLLGQSNHLHGLSRIPSRAGWDIADKARYETRQSVGWDMTQSHLVQHWRPRGDARRFITFKLPEEPRVVSMPLHVGLPIALFFLLWCNADSVLAGGNKLNRTTLDLDSVVYVKKNSSTLLGAQDLSIAGSTPRSDQKTEARGIGGVLDWLSNSFSRDRRPDKAFKSLGLNKLDGKFENEPKVKKWFDRMRQYRAREPHHVLFSDSEVFCLLGEHAPVETVLKVLKGNGMGDYAEMLRVDLEQPNSIMMEGLFNQWIEAKLHPSRVYHLLGLKTGEGLLTDSMTLDLTENLEVHRWLTYTARYTDSSRYKSVSTFSKYEKDSAYGKVEEMLLSKKSGDEGQARCEFKYAVFLQTMKKDKDLTMFADRLIHYQHFRLGKATEVLQLDFLRQLEHEKTHLNPKADDSRTLAIKAYYHYQAPLE
uniref:RxLR effector candidate protein n=1 Tax=Hyaloperonospora arabidopsidis (strain Emoy2) TaxID=559515 RepID=M4BW37_HYAAE|nr:RxLR effector candidate protein [Hyaloperonospora arabidopsidis Emoy2]